MANFKYPIKTFAKIRYNTCESGKKIEFIPEYRSYRCTGCKS